MDKKHIEAVARQIAENVAKNAQVAPQLCFPHIYLGLCDLLAERAASNPASPALPDHAPSILRDMLVIQEACGLHTDEYAPGSVIEYIKELEADAASPAPVAAITDERSAFEAHYRLLYLDDSAFKRYATTDAYQHSSIACYWHGWQARAALSSAPMAQAEPTLQPVADEPPVYWLESEEGARGQKPHYVVRSMLYTALLHTKKPSTRNPVWPLYAAPVAATPAVPAAPIERENGQ